MSGMFFETQCTLKIFLHYRHKLIDGNMIRYPTNLPAARSNFKKFSGGDIPKLALKAWKEGPERNGDKKQK